MIFPKDRLPESAYAVVSPPKAQASGATPGGYAKPAGGPEQGTMSPAHVDRHTGDCRFEVANPRFGHRYEIRWEY